MPKNYTLKRHDQRPAIDVAIATTESTESYAPPAAAKPAAPFGLTLASGTLQSTSTQNSYIDATWAIWPGLEPDDYTVEYATDAGFVSAAQLRARTPSIRIEGLIPDTAYWVRVAANFRGASSDYSAAATITTARDTAPPQNVSGAALAWTPRGDLGIAWTNPAESRFARVRVVIRGDAAGTIYEDAHLPGLPGAAQRLYYTAAQNVEDSGGDPSLTIEIHSQSWAGAYSAAPVVVAATKSPPDTPAAAAATWDAASGALHLTWSPVDGAVSYTLTLDGVARVVADTQYLYDAARNRQEHGGTAAGAITWSLVAVDGLGQASSVAAGGTATLGRPATPQAAAATWDAARGSCTFRWEPVAGAASYRLTIDNVPHTVSDTQFVYDAALNRVEHGGVADGSLSWSLVAVDGLGQTSLTPASGTATLAPPATPAGIVTDFGGPDAIWTWNAQTGVAGYRLTIDGITRDLVHARYTYDYALNRTEHASTADPSLTWSLVAFDGLGQTSTTPASGTLVNPAPGAPTAIVVTPGATGLFYSIAYPETRDLRAIEVRIIRNGSTIETRVDTIATGSYLTETAGTYTLGATVVDVFGQRSDEYVTPTGTILDPLRLADLRAGLVYTDSRATASATLDALKDDQRASGGVTYT